MIKGFLLIKLVPGLEADALSQIRAIPGVSEVNLVFGQWDAVAIAEAKSLFALARIIVAVGEMAAAREDIIEIDLNPVIAYPDGALAVDVRILIKA